METYLEVERAHRELMARVVALENEVKRTHQLGELADLAYALREAHKLAKNSAVELAKLGDTVAKLFCVLWASDPTVDERVETTYCACTPDVRYHPRVPKPSEDPEGYRAVLAAMGVTGSAVDNGLVRLSWEEVGEWVGRLRRDGRPVPSCIDLDRCVTEHRLSIRAKRKLVGDASSPGVARDLGTDPGEGTRRDGRDDQGTDDGDVPF